MAQFRLTAIAAATALTAMFASSAFAIDSKAACEYEGGETFTIYGDLVCVVPIRAEEFHGEEYDDAQLGVKTCEGKLIGDGQFCRITLIEGKKPVPAEAVAPADAETMTETLVDTAKTDAKDTMVETTKKAVEKVKEKAE